MNQATCKKMVICGEATEINDALDAVLSEVRNHSFDENTCFGVHLAMDEAISNAVRHGNHNNPALKVEIEYCVTNDEICVRVTDQGQGFDPSAIPDPTREDNLERPSGRGLMLIRAYMTQVQFNDRGNSVTMIKRRSPRKPQSSPHAG